MTKNDGAIHISSFEDTFVIHFGTRGHRINAYTLATALIGFADAAKAANASVNPGHHIEVVVEALDVGSFRATLRTLWNSSENLFSKENVRSIVLGIIASFIYEHTLGADPGVIVNVTTDEVVITQGDTKVVVPREMHEQTVRLRSNARFVEGISRAIRAIESDDDISTIGFGADPDVPEPPVEIPREKLAALSSGAVVPEEMTREVEEVTELRILRAILERSRRMWQFAWNGVRISAPIVDDGFYEKFFSHDIRIAPGDIPKVRLKIRQNKHEDLGVFMNQGYEVLEVMEHVPRESQDSWVK